MAVPALLTNPLVQQLAVAGGGVLLNEIFGGDPSPAELRNRLLIASRQRLKQNQGDVRRESTRRFDRLEQDLAAAGLSNSSAAQAGAREELYRSNNELYQSLFDNANAEARDIETQIEMGEFNRDLGRAQNRRQGVGSLVQGVAGYLGSKAFLKEGAEGMGKDDKGGGTKVGGAVPGVAAPPAPIAPPAARLGLGGGGQNVPGLPQEDEFDIYERSRNPLIGMILNR